MKKICPKCLNAQHFYVLKGEKKNSFVDGIGEFLMELDSFEDQAAGNRIKVTWYCDNCDAECMEIPDFAKANLHKDFKLTIMRDGKEVTETGRFLPADGDKLAVSFGGEILHITSGDLLKVADI